MKPRPKILRGREGACGASPGSELGWGEIVLGDRLTNVTRSLIKGMEHTCVSLAEGAFSPKYSVSESVSSITCRIGMGI